MSEKTVIEVNGVKLEIDMRYARRIEEMQIGQRVKVLKKVYDGHSVYPGVIVGFEPFAKLPTIVVAYVENSWDKADIKFMHYNSGSKECELVAAADPDFELDKERINKVFDRQVAGKQREIEEIEERRRYFETNFRAYWQKIIFPDQADA